MIDVDTIRTNPDLVKRKLSERGIAFNIDAVVAIEKEHRLMLGEVERLRSERNEKSVAAKDNPAARSAIKTLKKSLAEKEAKLSELKSALDAALADIPNLHKDDVPVGADASGNVVLREVGTKPARTDPRDYLSIGTTLGIIDIVRASKVSGARFGYLLGGMADLEFALVNYARATLRKEGFAFVIPPVMIKDANMAAMGYLAGGGERETYHLKDDGLYLVGTSEQSIGPMHRDEVLDAGDLPIRYLSFSTCFRREAGSYGKDTKGILRVHQFDKLEMFSFTTPDRSDAEHEFLLAMEERLVRGLGLPYRVVKLCSGDIGYPSARTYDIEIWMPSERAYRETHSTSTTTDYQARALNIRTSVDGEHVFVHMLNGTAFTNRTAIAIIENFQEPDGSVRIPDVLVPYMHGAKKIEPR